MFYYEKWLLYFLGWTLSSFASFAIICGLGAHLFCIHHHIWYNTNRDKQNFLLFSLLTSYLNWMLHFIPLQDSSRSSDIASDYCRCIIVKIVFQLHKPHCKEMWCSVGFCAWRMWSIITKLELSPWWVCKSLFSLGIACLSYWSKCPVCYRRTDMCLLALKLHIRDSHL